ncbi:PIPO, partial [Squash vein yellowing virus]|uniref:PIPO n=1 Tax=Squash vein yellowing virus TaxID=397544 RepID=UPI00026515B3
KDSFVRRRSYYERAHSTYLQRLIFITRAFIAEVWFETCTFARFPTKKRRSMFRYVFSVFVSHVASGIRDPTRLGLQSC